MLSLAIQSSYLRKFSYVREVKLQLFKFRRLNFRGIKLEVSRKKAKNGGTFACNAGCLLIASSYFHGRYVGHLYHGLFIFWFV